MTKQQEFLDLLINPENVYIQNGIRDFKDVLHEQMFDYTAKYVGCNKNILRIKKETDDSDAIDELDKYFTLCFGNVLHLVSIAPQQYVDTFERRYYIYKAHSETTWIDKSS